MQIRIENLHHYVQNLLNYPNLKDAEEIIEFLNELNFLHLLQIEGIREDVIKVFHVATDELIKIDKDVATLNKCISYLHKALSIDPLNHKSQELFKLCHIHLVLLNEEKRQENIDILSNILTVQPCDAQIQFIIGSMYMKQNNRQKALEHLKLALGLCSEKELKINILYCLGEVSFANNDNYVCRYYLMEAHKINENHPDVNNFLGMVYNNLGEVDKSIKHFERSLLHSNSSSSAIINMNLGTAYTHKIEFTKAIEYFNKALECNPLLVTALQNKLFNLNYIIHTIKDPMYLFELHKDINKFYPRVVIDYRESLPNYVPKTCEHNKLKIAFISSEFIYNGMCGVVSYYLNSIFKYMDRNKFDITCYSLKPITDVQTIHSNVTWKFIKGMVTDELKTLIINDGIDILFDLASHTGEDRLDVFAERAAPIQISYCGYPNTTGLASMDYHIVDRYCDSDGITPGPGGIVRPSTQKYYTEKLIFMDHCFLSYTPYVSALPELDIQPTIRNGYLTIGTFNKFNKINQYVVDVWENILESCPDVRLFVKSKEFKTPAVKEQFLSMWKNKALCDRITLKHYCNSNTEHLLEYNNIDIALDTFPYSGTCTTCDALLMGVPVVTLFDSERQYHVQNVSSSIMINSGLSEYVALTADEYVSKIQHYACNLDKLDGLKKSVREKFIENMCNYEQFVDDFENKLLNTYNNHKWS